MLNRGQKRRARISRNKLRLHLTFPLTCLTVSFLVILFTVPGCATTPEGSGNLSLKVGLMPAVDAAPMLLAEEKGYFREMGLTVELHIFNNAQDRQSALQTQSIDGAITDLVAVAANVAGGFDIKATMMTNGVFPLLSGKGAAEKQAVKVGMMEISVTNFLADEWLKEHYEIEKVYINDIPARLAAISNGQLDMGLFPEPLASMGELGGLEKTLFQPEGGYCPDVLVFTGQALRDKEKAIRLFHQACDRAVLQINQDPEIARDILMAKIPGLKPEIRDRIILPAYTETSLQDDAYIERVITWTASVMQKELGLAAADLVDRRFAAP